MRDKHAFGMLSPEEREAKLQRVYDLSAQVLEEAGIPFTSHGGGRHLIVNEQFDFWPGTRKWGVRGQKPNPKYGGGTKYRHGITRLIRHIKDRGSPGTGEDRTFNEWSAAGYQILRGSKSPYRNSKGVPMFLPSQVRYRG